MGPIHNHRADLAAAVAGVLWLAGAGHAQTARTRTLVYDTDRQEWIEVAPPPPGTPEGELRVIRELIKSEKYGAALSAADDFIEAHGASHALYPAALLARAEAHLGRQHFDEAHAVCQDFLNQFAGIDLTSEALRLEFIVAEAYLRGAKRKFLGMRILPAEDAGIRILDEISADYPDSAFAELAVKTKADHMFAVGDFALAELEYSRLITDFPQSRYREYALARSAKASLASFAGVDYDDAALIEAKDRYGGYQSRYPVAARRDRVAAVLDSIEEMQAEKEMRIGQYYERTEHLASAVFYYGLVRDEWPETIAARKAADRLELLGALRAAGGRETEPGP